MGAVIGEILPLALGVAISPIPVIAAILMLLSPKARVTSVGFLLGWVLGIVVAVTVFTLLSSILPEQDADASPQMPKWMQAIDKVTFPVAFGLGFLLSAINPKNLLMAAAAGVDIGSAGLDVGSIVLVIVVFTLIAASTVLVPVVGYLIAAEKLRGPLDALRVWLSKENAVIMAVLLLVIGISLIGKGIGSF